MDTLGLKGSLAAGASLVAAGVLAMVAVSSLVGFDLDDVAGVAPERGVSQVRLPELPPQEGAGGVVSQVRLGAAPRARARARARARVRALHRRAAAAGHHALRDRQQVAAEFVTRRRSARSGAGELLSRTPAAAPQADPAPPEATPGSRAPARGIVESVQRSLEDVVDPVSDEALKALDGTLGAAGRALIP